VTGEIALPEACRDLAATAAVPADVSILWRISSENILGEFRREIAEGRGSSLERSLSDYISASRGDDDECAISPLERCLSPSAPVWISAASADQAIAAARGLPRCASCADGRTIRISSQPIDMNGVYIVSLLTSIRGAVWVAHVTRGDRRRDLKRGGLELWRDVPMLRAAGASGLALAWDDTWRWTDTAARF